MGLSVISGILAARLLGPEGRGYLGVITFWSTFFAIFGRPPVADVMVVEAGGAGRGVSAALLRQMFLAARLCLALFMPIYLAVIWFYFAKYPPEVRLTAMGFATVALFCSFQSQVFEGVFRANSRFSLLFLFRLSVPTLYIACLLASLLFFEPDVRSFAGAQAAAMLISLSFRFFIASGERQLTQDREGEQDAGGARPWSEIRALLATFYGSTLFTYLTTQVDKAMVMLTQSVEDIGIYLVAIALALPAQGLISYAMNSIGLPALVKVRDDKRLGAYQRLLRLTFVTAILQALAIAVAAPFAIPLLFGEEFRVAGPMASAIAIATAPMSVRRAFAEIFRAERSANVVTLAEGGFLVAFAAIYAAFYFGGFTWPFVPAFFLANVAVLVFLSHRLRKLRPDARASAWLLPRFSTIKELLEIVQSAMTRGKQA